MDSTTAQQVPWLSLIIWLPIIAGFATLFIVDKEKRRLIKWFALIVSIATFLISINLYIAFDLETRGYQFIEESIWFESVGIMYSLGIDGIALPLIMLTSFIGVVAILASWDNINFRTNMYVAAFLLMTGLMNGVFCATDAILFYVFWEAMLIPMFLIIGIWGGPNRVYATIKFFLYTFIGSVLMLIALIYMGIEADSFSITVLQNLNLNFEVQNWIFWAFLIAFAVKIPMWPVHTWLPDAHVEAPTAGSIVLAAIMLKMGGYGFIRFSLPMVPDAALAWADLLMVLSLIAVVYIGLVAFVQTDMKKLIAYSSIAHMGFVTLGIFIAIVLASEEQLDVAELAMQGAMVQMLSHGFISGALFFGIGVLYDRMHSRDIESYGGVANKMPIFAAFFMLFAMANSGLPGTSGFVGEFFVIIATFQVNILYAFTAALTLILGAAYTLYMYRRVFFGQVGNKSVAMLEDINRREFFILALLGVLVLLLGIWPNPMTDLMETSIHYLLRCDVLGANALIEGC